MRVLMIVFLMCAMLGCAFPGLQPYQPATRDIGRPPIGEIATAYVGEELLVQGMAKEYDAIRLPQDITIRTGIVIGAGTYVRNGTGKGSRFYSALVNSGAKIQAPSTVQQTIQAYDNQQTICALSTQFLAICAKGAIFERTTVSTTSANEFQQTLLYNGRVGNKINVAYRESSGDLARPAFGNQVEYDLSESKTIGYRGARLEVIEATNELIKYRVLQNFNPVK